MAGLWIVLGAAVGAAALVAAARHYLVSRPAWRRRLQRWRSSTARANARLCRALRAEPQCGCAAADAGPKGAAVVSSKGLDAEGLDCNGGLEGCGEREEPRAYAICMLPGGGSDTGDVAQLVLGLQRQQAELQRQQAALGQLVQRLSERLGGG